MTKILFIVSTILTTSSFAQTQEEQAQMIYSYVCTPDAELSEKQIEVLANTPAVLSERESFQKFMTSPKETIITIATAFEQVEAQAKESIQQQLSSDPSKMQQLQSQAEAYMTEHKVSIEEAKAAVIAITAQMIAKEQMGGNSAPSTIIDLTNRSCELLNVVAPVIQKAGCKNSLGEAVNIAEFTAYCKTLEPQMVALSKTSEEIAKLEEETAKKIQELQVEAQKRAEPLVNKVNGEATDMFSAIMEYIGNSEGAPQTSTPLPKP